MPTTIRTIERPPQVKSERPPLLLLLHGYGSNEHDLMGLAPYLDPRLHIVSARAIIDLGFGGYAWYQLYGVPGNLRPDAPTRAHALEVLTKFVGSLTERSGTDAQQVYLLGFSQGAIMSLALALNHPQLVAGVVASSGYLDEALLTQVQPGALTDLDVLLLHGTEDEIIPVEGGRQARAYLAQTPARVEYHEYPIGHGISPEGLAAMSEWLSKRLDEES